MGLLAAVKRYVGLNHDQLLEIYEQRVQMWINGLNGKGGLSARRDYPNEAGQPVPRALVELPDNFSKEKLINKLIAGEPSFRFCCSLGRTECNTVEPNDSQR